MSHEEILEYEREKKYAFGQQFLNACENGDIDTVKKLINKVEFMYLSSGIDIACEKKYTRIIKFLLKNHAWPSDKSCLDEAYKDLVSTNSAALSLNKVGYIPKKIWYNPFSKRKKRSPLPDEIIKKITSFLYFGHKRKRSKKKIKYRGSNC
jgi:hypothetical protein